MERGGGGVEVEDEGGVAGAVGDGGAQQVDASFEDLRARVFAVSWMVVVKRRYPVVLNAQDKVALSRGWGAA